MQTPSITEQTNGYLISWADVALSAKVGQIHVHQDGRVTGNLEIFHNNGTGVIILLPSTQFNFSSEPTRNRMAKQLTEKHALKVEWLEVFDYLGHNIQELVRKGQEVEELITGDDVEPPRYLLYPFIVENMPNCIFGDPGSAKTECALLFAQIVMLPWKENPLNLKAPMNSVKCLFLDWEADRATIAWQLTRLARGMTPGNNLFINYRRCSLPLYQDLEQITKIVDNMGIKLVIIDALGLASGGELNNTEPALQFFQALRKIKATPLVLAHNAKDPEQRKKSIYGNQHYTAEMRNIWEIVKRQEPDEDEMEIALFHRKSPPFQKLSKPIGFKYVFETDSTKVESHDPQKVSDFLDKMGTRDRILEVLKGEKLTVENIKELLPDLSDNNIRRTLSELCSKGLLVNPKRGLYAIKTQQDDLLS